MKKQIIEALHCLKRGRLRQCKEILQEILKILEDERGYASPQEKADTEKP